MGTCKQCGQYSSGVLCYDCASLRRQDQADQESIQRRIQEDQEYSQRIFAVKDKISSILINQENSQEDTIKKKIKDIIKLFSIQIYESDIFGSLISTNSIFKDAFMEASLDMIRASETQWNWHIIFHDEYMNTPAILSEFQIWINEKGKSRKEFQLASISLSSFLKDKKRIKEENNLQQKRSEDKEEHRKILESSFGGENDLTFNGILAQLTLGSLCFCPNCQKLSKQSINAIDGSKLTDILSIQKQGVVLPRKCATCNFDWNHVVSYWLIFIIFLVFMGFASSVFSSKA
jgi:hypothetical protein